MQMSMVGGAQPSCLGPPTLPENPTHATAHHYMALFICGFVPGVGVGCVLGIWIVIRSVGISLARHGDPAGERERRWYWRERERRPE